MAKILRGSFRAPPPQIVQLPRVKIEILTHLFAGNCSRGRAERLTSPEGGSRHNLGVADGAAAQIPPDAQHHLGREELHHHLPPPHRPPQVSRGINIDSELSRAFMFLAYESNFATIYTVCREIWVALLTLVMPLWHFG